MQLRPSQQNIRISTNCLRMWSLRTNSHSISPGITNSPSRTERRQLSDRSMDYRKKNSPKCAVISKNDWQKDISENQSRQQGIQYCLYPRKTENYECAHHYTDKRSAGIFPTRTSNCKYQWYDCQNDICATHLWDKRRRPWFPGHEDPADLMQMQLTVNGQCTQDKWQTCLNANCTRH